MVEYCSSVRNIKASVSCLLPPQVLLLVKILYCYSASSGPGEKPQATASYKVMEQDSSHSPPFTTNFTSPILQSFLNKISQQCHEA